MNWDNDNIDEKSSFDFATFRRCGTCCGTFFKHPVFGYFCKHNRSKINAPPDSQTPRIALRFQDTRFNYHISIDKPKYTSLMKRIKRHVLFFLTCVIGTSNKSLQSDMLTNHLMKNVCTSIRKILIHLFSHYKCFEYK